jgi:hypothetical protein
MGCRKLARVFYYVCNIVTLLPADGFSTVGTGGEAERFLDLDGKN